MSQNLCLQAKLANRLAVASRFLRGSRGRELDVWGNVNFVNPESMVALGLLTVNAKVIKSASDLDLSV